ncbi:hypothetical protein ACFVGN_31195 [Streptomyces sp. NPDC057757]|uniref:hypothetical protein n=1 Tax=Streptomyces sp. NPDC057757 TaxID=3346241 RepID=UPI00368EA0D8
MADGEAVEAVNDASDDAPARDTAAIVPDAATPAAANAFRMNRRRDAKPGEPGS